MKYLKQKTLSRFTANNNALIVHDIRGSAASSNGGRAVMDITGGLRLPKGTTNQRPQVSNVRNGNGPNGFIRYNTTTNSIEGYINGVWEVIRASSASAITTSTIGPGDLVETKFGPLTTVSSGTSYLASGNNIIVLVENVWQIYGTNFTLEQNPAGTSSATGYLAGAAYPAGWYLVFGDAVPVGKNVTVYYGFGN